MSWGEAIIAALCIIGAVAAFVLGCFALEAILTARYSWGLRWLGVVYIIGGLAIVVKVSAGI